MDSIGLDALRETRETLSGLAQFLRLVAKRVPEGQEHRMAEVAESIQAIADDIEIRDVSGACGRRLDHWVRA